MLFSRDANVRQKFLTFVDDSTIFWISNIMYFIRKKNGRAKSNNENSIR